MKRSAVKLGKKGDILGMPPAVFAVIVLSAIILIFLIVPFGSKVMKLIIPAKTDCINQEEWPKILSILKKLDEGELDKWETQFFNKNCNLVSFTFSHGLQNHKIKPGSHISLGNEPQLCLCEVKEEACSSPLCYKFKNFETINSKQFETTDYADQLTLKFNRNNKDLLVNVVGLMKEPEPVAYTFAEDYRILDPFGLINKLDLTFSTREISSFLPIVDVKPSEQFTPADIPFVKDFTFFFYVKLTRAVKELPLSAIKENPQLIDSNTVESAEIELNIPKDKFSKLSEELKNGVKLYYLKDNSWQYSRLSCKEASDNFVCSATLNSFSSDFAVSASHSSYQNINNIYLGDFVYGEKRDIKDINLIILHHTGGSNLKGALAGLKERRLSAHYIIDKNGDIYYLVDDGFIAFHVKGGYNQRSVGIEIVNTGNAADLYTEEQYISLNYLLDFLTKEYGVSKDNIKGHYEIPGNEDKWDPSPNFVWEKLGLQNRNAVITTFCQSRIPAGAGYNCGAVA